MHARESVYVEIATNNENSNLSTFRSKALSNVTLDFTSSPPVWSGVESVDDSAPSAYNGVNYTSASLSGGRKTYLY